MPVIGAVSGEPYVVASPQLAASPILRGHRAAIPHREALILQATINHPWLLHDHLEELAGLEFRHSELAKLKTALIDIFAHGALLDGEALMAELGRRGLDEAARLSNTKVFHAGTARAGDQIVTNGGRVLGVTAWAGDLRAARAGAYTAVEKIEFDGAYFRRDIAAKALR